MTIENEIEKRLLAFPKLNSYTEESLAIDQIQVLHDGFRSHFGDKFNSIVTGDWGNKSEIRNFTAQRLLRILEAEKIKNELTQENPNSIELLPTFELNEDDRARMLKLASDIRKVVTASTDFDHPHKVRLLNRLAAMENEIHKPKGLYDVFLGGMSDFGETAGKFGKDIKPLTDRVREMVGIARKNTKEYEKLAPPEDLKELPHPDDFDDDQSE